MSTLLADIRYGARLLLKSPGFAVVAIAALALGIGANSAIFSAINTALLQPLPYHDASRLAFVWEDATFAGFPKNTPAPANFVDWRRQNHVFTDMAAVRTIAANITEDGPPDFVFGARVTPSFFSVLATPAIAGRILTADDDRAGEKVVVLSYSLWRRRYGADRSLIGRTMLINDEKYTVVGVMPRGFRLPYDKTDFWTPARLTPEELARRGSHYLAIIARLKPGVTFERAQNDMTAIAKRLEREYPATNQRVGAVVVPLREQLVADYRTGLIALLIGAGCVLLIACSNVANLLLARAAGRQREIAVRAALGAGRGRLVRQLVTESVLLSATGGALGVLLARLGLRILEHVVPVQLEAAPAIDGQVLLFTLAVSIATGVIFGVFPALHASRLELNEALKQGSRGSAGGRSGRYRDILVAAEVGLAIVLLVGAGLMVQTLYNMRSVDVGFRAENLLTMRSRPPLPKYEDPQKRLQFFDSVLDRIRVLPGVRGAAYSSMLPFESIGNTVGFHIEGRARIPNAPYDSLYRLATNDYLQTLGARVVEGRFFGPQDGPGSPPVAIVNETMKREYFNGESPVGQRIVVGTNEKYTIVGVVGEIRERGIDVERKAALYLPICQTPDSWAIPSELVIRADRDPLKLANAVRKAIWSVDPDMPVTAVQTMQELIDAGFATRAQQMQLLAAFAALALGLAALGIYGVLSYAVTERTREIGVRVALGAGCTDVVRMVARRGIVLTVAGLAIGTAAAFGAARAMQSMLYGVAPSDPRIYALVSTAILLVALAACAVPARRAASVDPIVALRDE
jgi:putative ABC transport system permease protein